MNSRPLILNSLPSDYQAAFLENWLLECQRHQCEQRDYAFARSLQEEEDQKEEDRRIAINLNHEECQERERQERERQERERQERERQERNNDVLSSTVSVAAGALFGALVHSIMTCRHTQ